MADRVKPKASGEGGGSYFEAPATDLKFIHSGCSLLNLVVGGRPAGAYPLGRMVNIIGDKSTGKTLLAIEACANFARDYPKGLIWYREAEAAFDPNYAEALGMPVHRISFNDDDREFDTVEDFYEDLIKCIAEANNKKAPGLYIVDSLDALSDRAELAREIDKGTFGAGKAKQLSQLFRRLIREVKKSQVCVVIISQIRANIGAMFGDKTSRSGGAAMDFYASWVIKLAHIKTLKATKGGMERATGIRIRVKCTKNKIALPLRDCEYVVRFSYGIENYEAGLDWLIKASMTKELGISKEKANALIDESYDWDAATLAEEQIKLDAALARGWAKVERSFIPTRKKY